MQNTIASALPKVRQGLTLAVLGCALLAVPGAARAACPAPGPIDVRIITEPPSPQYRHQMNRAQLSAIAGHGHMSNDKSRAGLTHSQTGISINPLVESIPQGNGLLCAAVRRVEVTWKMTILQVDIAAEYQPGSCPYNEIVRHENEHVAIHQRAFLAATAELKARLTDALRREPTYLVRGSAQDAAQQGALRMMAAAKPVLERYEADTRRENAAIDTPQNYRAVSARCRDW